MVLEGCSLLKMIIVQLNTNSLNSQCGLNQNEMNALPGTNPNSSPVNITSSSYRDLLPPRPGRSRWGCAGGGNLGKEPGTSGTADPNSSASCWAFCLRLPLPPQLQTEPTDHGETDYYHDHGCVL